MNPRFKEHKKFTLVLNSHSLTSFQNCEEKYRLREVEHLELDKPYYPFVRGAIISKALQIWYMAKKKSYSDEELEKIEMFLFKRLTRSKDLNSLGPKGDGLAIGSRLMQYFEKYRHENYEILAVEQGFSKILYEDKNVLFIYEGRPDLVVNFGRNFGHGPIDHKSESRRFDLYSFQNQFLGYCWAMDSTMGLINYIGLQTDGKDGDVLRREAFNFLPSQIEQWKQDTIRWYSRIMRTIVSSTYLRSWRCEEKYSLCSYTKICEQPNERTKLIQIRDYYKKVDPHKSW